MSFRQDEQYQEWVRRYRESVREAEGRLRQARDRIKAQADALRNLKTEIQADTTGRINQAHIDEVTAKINKFDNWVASIDAALAG